MVVPPPIATPCTATTIGFSKAINALSSADCGDSPGPGGFLRKSPMSLPAQNASPAPCQSTTWTASSASAALRISARLVYMAAVIAFFRAGRLNSTRRMPPLRSVIMSLIVASFSVGVARSDRVFLCLRHGAAFAQALDAAGVEAEFAQDLLGMLAEVGRAPGRSLGDAMHRNRAADGRGQPAAGTFQRNDDAVRRQLRIVDHLLRSADFAKGDVHAGENRMPMRHGLGAENLVKDR